LEPTARPLLFGLFKRTSPPVFAASAVVMIGLVLFVLRDPARAQVVFAWTQDAIAVHLGWVYRYTTTILLVFGLGLLASRYGRIRLGRADEKPAFAFVSWFAMMFSAGMGIGLLFWSVSEPLTHFIDPPFAEPGTRAAAAEAMRYTFFHWGLHAWAVYALVGLALAYFGFRRGLPLTLRSALFPLLGRRIFGWPGHVVDVIAVCATMFGVATSLGLGVIQLNAGLNYLTGVPIATWIQIAMIALITGMATISVVRGLDRGIRQLSRLNIAIALALLAAVFALGPSVFLLDFYGQTLADYLQNIVAMSLWADVLRDSDWQQQWTTFYWAWWISWSPFVGMFVARVSRGRTIRQFLVGVLLVASGTTTAWLTVFGGTALHLQLFQGADIAVAAAADVSRGMFLMLEELPLSWLLATVASLTLVTFFVTSSDSGSFVIDIITAGGDPDPPKAQRVFWSIMEGVIAATLLLGGGLQALQTAAIVSGLPFALVLLILCAGLWRALSRESAAGALDEPDVGEPLPSRAEDRERATKAERGRPVNELAPDPAPPATGTDAESPNRTA
jgi:choline/glycine/proline betaine transport protein